jgi:thiol-disulfide isomerase/thioredoxin
MEPLLLRLIGVAVLIVVAIAAGRVLRARDGRVTVVDNGARVASHHLDAVGLRLDGAAAGAVLLGSPTCAPCDTVKRVLGELEAERPSFRWVYADAGEHLGLAQEHRIMRVPTLLVVEPDGRIVARTSGVPNRDALRRVLDEGASLDDVAA